MGMTDMQYKSVLREYLAALQEIQKEVGADNEKLKSLIDRINQSLQD